MFIIKQLKVLGFVALLFTLGACSVSPTDSSWLGAVKGKKVVSSPDTVATFSTHGQIIDRVATLSAFYVYFLNMPLFFMTAYFLYVHTFIIPYLPLFCKNMHLKPVLLL